MFCTECFLVSFYFTKLSVLLKVINLNYEFSQLPKSTFHQALDKFGPELGTSDYRHLQM